jgi:hypothetical protein
MSESATVIKKVHSPARSTLLLSEQNPTFLHSLRRAPEEPHLCFILRLELVVLGDIPVQGAHHDHGHHARQEEHNHEGVDDAEPVDLIIGHQEVSVPAGSPLDVADLQSSSRRDMRKSSTSTSLEFVLPRPVHTCGNAASKAGNPLKSTDCLKRS